MKENPLVLEAMRSLGIVPTERGAVKKFADHEKIKVSAKTVTGWKNHNLPELAESFLKTVIENAQLREQIKTSQEFKKHLRDFLKKDES